MFKQRIISVIGSPTWVGAAAGSSGPVTASQGLIATLPARECSTGSSTGGGC